jgi:7-cyano-7-deazaguanine synthase in queuosine biosynthesis
MKTWHIILRTNNKDKYNYSCSKREKKFIIPFKSFTETESVVRTHVFEDLKKNKLVLSQNAYDLLNIGISVYAIDQIVSREIDGFQKWSRHFILHMPVHSVDSWTSIKDDFENLLSFLSGDKWEIRLREHSERLETQDHLFNNPDNFEIVSLFSGGLDSYIGAINLLEKGKKTVLVSHYKGGTPEKASQEMLYEKIKKTYNDVKHLHIQFFVQPNQDHSLAIKENTSRCRSLVFMVLGIAVANSLGDNINLNIPENGFISLNVPLTPTRLSSHSTRTTHPHYIELFNRILIALNIKTSLINPYQFLTKGEMLQKCLNLELLKSNFKTTVSCAHPDRSRWLGGSPSKACGYCTPCIIRRAALKKAGLTEAGYLINILRNPPDPKTITGRDLRAFKLSIERFKKLDSFSILMQILGSGPLPFKKKTELDQYVDIYKNGVKEVSDFLGL